MNLSCEEIVAPVETLDGMTNYCLWCQRPVGSRHADDCVIFQKTVVVEMTVRMVVSVPRNWTAHNVEFHRNEGSWCADNGIADLVNWIDRQGISSSRCTCSATTYKFVREATQEDHDSLPLLI